MLDSEAFSTLGTPVPHCTLCGSHELRKLGYLPAQSVHDIWLQTYDIPVEHLFPRWKTTNYECQSCGLDFYYPPCAADDGVYAQLQRFAWYYEENKWEFRASIERLGPPGSVLEVGCGVGNFLQALRAEGFTDVCGVDSNKRALESLASLAIPAFECLEQVKGRRFDYIFAFQVLEHIPDPHAFLAALVPLLSERGRIYVAVPNQDSFIADDPKQELNQPPHHCSRFRARTFQNLSDFLPLECEQLAYEPLSDHHVGWYVATRMQQLPPKSLASWVAWRAVAPVAQRLLKIDRVRSHIKGHTMLAVLRHAPHTTRERDAARLAASQ